MSLKRSTIVERFLFAKIQLSIYYSEKTMLYLAPLLIALGYWMYRRPSLAEKAALDFDKTEKRLLQYALDWNTPSPFGSIDRTVQTTNLQNDVYFQRLFSAYVEAFFLYNKYYGRTLPQVILFRIMELSVHDETREKVLAQIVKNNKIYSREKSLEVVG